MNNEEHKTESDFEKESNESDFVKLAERRERKIEEHLTWDLKRLKHL